MSEYIIKNRMSLDEIKMLHEEKKKLKRERSVRQEEFIKKFIELNPNCDKGLIRRFFSKIDIRSDDECWKWLGQILPNGYGLFFINGNKDYVHRIAWLLAYSEIPEKLEIHHKCHNRLCVNINHLELINHKENIERRNTPKGSNHYASLLTEEIVKEIREKYTKTKMSQSELGREYNVTEDVVWAIVNNKTYKDNNYKIPLYKSGKEGEHNSHAKLTWEQVKEIREKAKKGVRITDLAEKYKLERHAISNIIHNKTWVE